MAEETTTRSLGTVKATLTAYQTLNNIGKNPLNDDGTVGGEESDSLFTRPHLGIVGSVAVAGLLAAIASFVLVTAHLVDLASVTLMLIAPLVVVQKHMLRKLGGMRGLQNSLRQSANRFMQQNLTLHMSVSKLSHNVESLSKVEGKLQGIAEKSGTKVDHLFDTVKENGEIQKHIKKALETKVMQQIMTACLQVDRDRNFTLGPQEVKILEMRLSNIPGVIFDKTRFDAFLQSDQGELALSDVCGIARVLRDNSVPEAQRIFRFAPQKVLQQGKASSPRRGLFGMGSARHDLVP
jgi:hypothetical protein